MKKLTLFAVALFSAGIVSAQTVVHVWENPRDWWSSHFYYDRDSSEYYRANEMTMDLFGNYQPQIRAHASDSRWGGGLGLNYFFTRELGLGAEVYAADDEGKLVDMIAGNAIIRLPIPNTSIAPYALGGGGRATNPIWEWTWHAGGGLELRLNPVTGLFADWRYIWSDKSPDGQLARAGLRIAF